MPSSAPWPGSTSSPPWWGRWRRRRTGREPRREGRPSPRLVGDDLAQLRAVVPGSDGTHRARPRAHAHRLGVGVAAGEVHALEHLAVGDARRGEEDVVAGDEAVLVEDLVEVVAGVERRLLLLLVAGPQPAEDLPPGALDGRRRQHALG